MATVRSETIRYTAPATLSDVGGDDSFEPVVIIDGPSSSSSSSASSTDAAASHDCSICLDSLLDPSADSVRLKSCQHEFHRTCIQDCLQHHQCCPICRKPVGEPQGRSPSGTMTISTIRSHCPGFLSDTTAIQITYSLHSGIQHAYHQHPGVRYSGTSRTAYLPNNADGQKLLLRLKYAFEHGLAFTIGTSLTTHQPNQVVWSSIHHKTSLSGGPHGFPDPLYLDNTNESLDALNVPDATELESNKRPRQQRTSAASAATAALAALAAAVLPAPMAAPAAPVAGLPPPAAASTSTVSFVVCKQSISYQAPTSVPAGYGTCPSGIMAIEPISQHCPGFPATTTLVQITYDIPNGIQENYHDNPGSTFRGATRTTYLPNNNEGRQLLQRMKCAWTRGWIFTVGTSMTSGRSDIVVWSTAIPHKTSLSGGPFGFPDAHYLAHANQALDAIGIPPAHACP